MHDVGTPIDFVADDVIDMRFIGYEKEGKAAPTHLWLNNVRDSFVECIAASDVPPRCYRISGPRTRNLYLRSAGAIDWHKHLVIESDVQGGVVHPQGS
jgi:hypothetical protein